jgi:pyruvate-formate lyase-activating enzyme
MICNICEKRCCIEEGETGSCRMYHCLDGDIVERYPDRYLAAVETSIESMPMTHYHPGGRFLQVCTVGCNFTCEGCVSEMLTDSLSSIGGSFLELSPEDVVERAIDRNCIGVMFCFNEPTVSYYTFLRLARKARRSGLLVGISTNGYMTREALEGLVHYVDFVNLGLKGFSDRCYDECGAASSEPVWRNLRLLHEHGKYLELSIVFRKYGEMEVLKAARAIAELSPEIPLQVMRFIPFGDASLELEPGVREAERLCLEARKLLRHVYLFNSPGTELMNSICPQCGEKIMERGFSGPMASNLFRHMPDGVCSCGYRLPLKGAIHDHEFKDTGLFGGYRNVVSMNMIRSILDLLGVTDRETVNECMTRVLRDEFIRNLYERLNSMEAYFDTVDYFAALTGTSGRGRDYRQYCGMRAAMIGGMTMGLARPSVYCPLSHPLIAMFDDKMEARLIEAAGGFLANTSIERDKKPGITISPEEFNRMAPDMIIMSDSAAWPVNDFTDYCIEKGLDAPALQKGRVFNLYPYRISAAPDWILGLMASANAIHPGVFSFNMEAEAEEFFNTFYQIPFSSVRSRSFPARLRGKGNKTNFLDGINVSNTHMPVT